MFPLCGAGAGGSGWFDTDPPVCSKAVEERQAELRAACLTYSQAREGGTPRAALQS